jgi:aminoglycoside 3-N-acetyltransferase
MLTYRNLFSSFRQLDLRQTPVIAHASLSAFGEVQGGADTLLGALLATTGGLMMPTFTYKTMIVPEIGPADNGISYSSGKDANLMAEFFRPNMPADHTMGVIPEALRQLPNARRSMHPIQSFAGIDVDSAIDSQTLDDPLAPIGELTESGGWVLLLGVDHTANTSIHYAEQQAGRKTFTRWALTLNGVVACPRWPGCSGEFEQISPYVEPSSVKIQVGSALVRAIPLQVLVKAVKEMIAKDAHALLCDRSDCGRCNAVRQAHPQ